LKRSRADARLAGPTVDTSGDFAATDTGDEGSVAGRMVVAVVVAVADEAATAVAGREKKLL
jgi:hypothetical protein